MAVETNKREPKSITVSVIKADIGGWVGHSAIHPALIDSAHRQLETAKTSGMLVDYHVTACGDDLQLIMTHRYGVDSEVIHRLAWETFEGGTQVAKDLHLNGAGQDLLSDAFSGNVRGQGPGVAEMDITERKSEPVLIFMADKTSAGAWNLPLYKMFADPFTTAGLVIAPALHQGFRFEVHDIREHKKITFDCPEDLYDMLMFIGSPGKYTVKHVFSRADGTIAAASSTGTALAHCGKVCRQGRPGHDRAGAAEFSCRRRSAGPVSLSLDHRGLDEGVTLRSVDAGVGEASDADPVRWPSARGLCRISVSRRTTHWAARHVRRSVLR